MQHLGNNNLHMEQNQLHKLNFFPSISLVSRWWYFFTYWDSLSTRLTGIKQNGLELHEKANRKADLKDFIYLLNLDLTLHTPQVKGKHSAGIICH